MAEKDSRPGITGTATPSQTNTNGHHPGGAFQHTGGADSCAGCGTTLRRRDSRAAGACLACRVVAEAVAR